MIERIVHSCVLALVIVLSGCAMMPAGKPSLGRSQGDVTSARFSCLTPDTCWSFMEAGESGDSPRALLELRKNTWVPSEHRHWFSRGILFLDQMNGWGIDNMGIYYTSSGGSDWVRKGDSPFGRQMRDVCFSDKHNGWVLSDYGAIALTHDSGVTWDAFSMGIKGNISSLFFLNTSVGWAILDGSVLLATIDGGKTWLKTGTGVPAGKISQIHFDDRQNGWAALNGSGVLIVTKDGGHTWSDPGRSSGHYQFVYFFDQNHGWSILPGTGIVHTADGGKSWVHQNIEYHWYEHPMNLIWQVPAVVIAVPLAIVGYLSMPISLLIHLIYE